MLKITIELGGNTTTKEIVANPAMATALAREVMQGSEYPWGDGSESVAPSPRQWANASNEDLLPALADTIAVALTRKARRGRKNER